ncbi:MAG: iron-sulfur cluster assembly scaffold protein [Chloroflexota bacterium]|nr:iron-sulfur cluster assembly scaffold protein [Chloroflexota bacterium]
MTNIRQQFSEQVIDHAQNPRNVGEIQGADGFASIIGPCGDTMEIWIKVKDDRIIKCNFWTDGCRPSIACGSMVTELAIDRRTIEARRISQDTVLQALGDLPNDHRHCALLAAETLQKAIEDYTSCSREPWKKAYRKH